MCSSNQDGGDHTGFKCVFLDSVNDLFFCKECSLVAKRLTATSCCGESYCHDCIATFTEQHKPCPECGQQDFTIYEQLRYQKKIAALKVHCNFKTRGCKWRGELQKLDHHLNVDCQNVDIKCPLNCQQGVPKNQIEQHLTEECTKRPYVCHHCAFKATYEEVVNKHLPECKYVPLNCPNRCGVTCDREDLEDHMKMCRLEEVVCKFKDMGCDGRYVREDEDKYAERNTQKHLALVASDVEKTKEVLQKKVKEQQQKIKKLEEKLSEQELYLQDQKQQLGEQEQKLWKQDQVREREQKIEKHELRLKEQELKFGEQKRKLEEQEKKVSSWECKLKEKEQNMEEQEKKLGEHSQKISKLEHLFEILELGLAEHNKKLNMVQPNNKLTGQQWIDLTRTFEMQNFHAEKAKDKPGDWKSPATYTHLHGYKICVGVDANGVGNARKRGICVHLYALKGEYDEDLKWPAMARFTVGLTSQKGGRNAERSLEKQWDRPVEGYQKLGSFEQRYVYHTGFMFSAFLQHVAVSDFLNNKTLEFYLKVVTF